MTAHSAQLVSAQGLELRRGDHSLCTDVSIAVSRGELVHLFGSNGSGKTTLLETLAGIRRVVAGRVCGAEDVVWVGHRNGLSMALTPLENLTAWCEITGNDASRVMPALDRLGVARRRHRACASLSAGQRRRVALARLLIGNCALWLLDEPFAALDGDGVERLGDILDGHCDGGGGVLLTSHQTLPAAVSHAARIVELVP